jgi:hypothetical protein
VSVDISLRIEKKLRKGSVLVPRLSGVVESRAMACSCTRLPAGASLVEALSTSGRSGVGSRGQAQIIERPAIPGRRSKFLAGESRLCQTLESCQSSEDLMRQSKRDVRCEAGPTGRDVRAKAAVKDLSAVQEDVEKTEMVAGDTYGVPAELTLPRVSSGKTFVAPLYPGFKSR